MRAPLPPRRSSRPLRLTLPAALGALLDAEAARTGEPVPTVAATLLAEGVALVQARLRHLRRVSRTRAPGPRR
jgi:hypothetical protein